MELWSAEIYDYSYETPFLVGVYDTEQKARDAADIVLARYRERNPNVPEDRFVPYVGPIQLNGFCSGIMDFLGTELMEEYS